MPANEYFIIEGKLNDCRYKGLGCEEKVVLIVEIWDISLAGTRTLNNNQDNVLNITYSFITINSRVTYFPKKDLLISYISCICWYHNIMHEYKIFSHLFFQRPLWAIERSENYLRKKSKSSTISINSCSIKGDERTNEQLFSPSFFISP